MKMRIKIVSILVLLFLINSMQVNACSTIMLKKGDELIFGHNLNEGDSGIGGIVFVNKRGVFKMGRSLNEMMFKDVTKPSKLSWISRYGSVTFNTFGKDLPDGGMNETGFYIWEMNEASDYPKGDSLHKLSQMGWMQFLLDNCSTIDEALELTKTIEIDGWTWHYFLADASGDCATLAFIDGKMKINRGKTMPVTGLYNTPYDREIEVSKYYENFGGLYKVELDNPNVPRYVKTDWLIKNYDPKQNAVDYGFYMLDKIKVNDVAEWSIIFDVHRNHVYFRTRINPTIKHFSLNDIDYSVKTGDCVIQNMDIKEGGDVLEKLHSYTAKEMSDFLYSLNPLFPGFLTRGGLTVETAIDNFTNHWVRPTKKENQFFAGKWATKPEDPKKNPLVLELNTNENLVSGKVTAPDGFEYPVDHIFMINNKMTITFLTKSGRMLELKMKIEGDTIKAKAFGIEDFMGDYTFYRQ